jgi:hypothetical protein
MAFAVLLQLEIVLLPWGRQCSNRYFEDWSVLTTHRMASMVKKPIVKVASQTSANWLELNGLIRRL